MGAPLRALRRTESELSDFLCAEECGCHRRRAPRRRVGDRSRRCGRGHGSGSRHLRRVGGRPVPQRTCGRHGGHPRRQGLLGGGLRRRHLQLRRRRLRRVGGRPAPQRTRGRHGGHPRRQGLLGGGLRRRHLQLRRRRVRGLGGGPAAQRADRGHGSHPRRQGATGRWPPTAASSASATPGSSARWGAARSTSPSWAWRPPPTPRATGWWPPTAASSASATPPSPGRWAASTSTHPWSAWRPPPTPRGYWEVASDGGIFSFGDATFAGLGGRPAAQRTRRRHGGHPRRQGVLGGGRRRRHLQLRRRRVRGLGRAPAGPPQDRPLRGLDGHGGGQGLRLPRAGGRRFRVRAGLRRNRRVRLPGEHGHGRRHPGSRRRSVLVFSGDNFTPCMAGDPIGSPQYYAKYQADIQAAIDIFRPHGTEVFLSGIPYDALCKCEPERRQSESALCLHCGGQCRCHLRRRRPSRSWPTGHSRGRSLALQASPAPGPSGTNVVRAPDGVHFCPTGNTTQEGYFAVCDVYASGAFRFAAAMLGPALNP